MNDPNPVPSYFGVRYVLWMVFWKNAITTLSIIQIFFAALVLASNNGTEMVTPTVYRWTVLLNAVLVTILARFDRSQTPNSLTKPDPKGPTP